MTATTADGHPIETEYRTIVSDNLRWTRFRGRPGDVFVCTPPKCGTTWMQTIVATLLFPDGDMPGNVMDTAPWIDARFVDLDEIMNRLEAQTFRRSVKSHTPADGIPWYDDASYIVVARDGRDAFMSFHNHMTHMRPDVIMELVMSAPADGIDLGDMPPLDDIHAFYAWWLDQAMWFDHLGSFWARRDRPNVHLAHFDDMKADLDGEMRRVAAFLGVEIDEARWPEQVERCTFASMKARADEIADFDSHFVGGAETFLYKGTNGRWRDVLTAEELAAFDRRAAELLPADAVAWLASREGAVS